MNMQQMLAQAQKMQRELQKAMNELKEKEFVINKNGMVVVTVTGNKEVKSIDINNLTPLEALNKLSEIKKLVGG